MGSLGRFTAFSLTIGFVLVVVWPLTGTSSGQPDRASAVTSAVLAENWRDVSRDAGKGSRDAAVASWLEAHAAFALDRPDDALCQFTLISSTPAALPTWLLWTDTLVTAHRRS